MEGAVERGYYNEKLASFLEGCLWSDENPQDGTAKELLLKVDKFFSDFDRQVASKHELYQLQGEIKGFLK